MPLSPLFQPTDYAGLPGWCDDRQAQAFEAFRRSAGRIHVKPYRTGTLGVSADAFADAFSEAERAGTLSDAEARTFFERHFAPARIAPESGRGFVTGFYEPEVGASPTRTATHHVPLLARPADLVDVD